MLFFIVPLLSFWTRVPQPRGIPARARAAQAQTKAISIPQQRTYDDDTPFPLTLTPNALHVPLTAWAEAHREELLALVAKHDAVLLRGFDEARDAVHFSNFVASLQLAEFEMGCSAAPRTNLAPGVFTANEAPPTEPIPFHHEMAQCDEQPSYVAFFCETPAAGGGATPIIPSHAVARHLRESHGAVAERLARLGVRYARTLPLEHDATSPIGKSWKAAFNASTRAEAEAAMAAVGTEATWLPNGDVRTVTRRLPALVRHAATGREMFFNAVVAAHQGWIDSRNAIGEAVLYGDGSALDEPTLEAFASAGAYMREHAVAFRWRRGDVLLLDNHKALHSRQPFLGPRRILAALMGDRTDRPTPPPFEPPFEAPEEAARAAADEATEAAAAADEATGAAAAGGATAAADEAAADEAVADEAVAVAGAVRAALPLRIRGFAKRLLRLRGGGLAGASGVTGGAPPEAPRLTLRSGAQMPAIGVGLWKVPKAASAETVTRAIAHGYRHLDCACDYGNEAEVGEGIRAAISQGLVTRDELWVTSKLWNTYHAREHVAPACRRTLTDLGLDFVDLYLVHFPIALRFVPFEVRYPPEWVHEPRAAEPTMELAAVPFRETWEGMEAVHAAGLARHIGVCNMNTAGLRDVLSYARTPPEVLQVELHPYLQQPRLLRFCREHGIAVTGFSPLGAGSYVELSMATEAESALRDATVVALAEARGVSPAQLILRWALQRGVAVVPKSTKEARLRENLEVGGLVALDEDEMAAMAGLDRHRRFNDPGEFCEGMGVFCPIYD